MQANWPTCMGTRTATMLTWSTWTLLVFSLHCATTSTTSAEYRRLCCKPWSQTDICQDQKWCWWLRRFFDTALSFYSSLWKFYKIYFALCKNKIDFKLTYNMWIHLLHVCNTRLCQKGTLLCQTAALCIQLVNKEQAQEQHFPLFHLSETNWYKSVKYVITPSPTRRQIHKAKSKIGINKNTLVIWSLVSWTIQ